MTSAVSPRGTLPRMAASHGLSEPAIVETIDRELRAPAAAGIAGLLFAGLFATSIALLYRTPAKGSSAAEIAHWYLQNQAKTLGLVGLYLAPFSGIAFLWFVAVVRDQIGDREDRFFATVFLAGGILFVALLFAASAVASSLVVGVRYLDQQPPTAAENELLRALAYTLMFGFASRAAALFMLSTATVGLRTGAFPRWFALVGYAVGIALLLVVSFYDWVILALPAWVAFVSVVILVRERSRHRGATGAVPPGHPTD